MISICLVSYMRDHESFTEEIVFVGNHLSKIFQGFRCVIYTESTVSIPSNILFPVKQKRLPGTKYKRMKQLLETEEADYYLSIDNDVAANLPLFEQFVSHVVNGSYDIGWGKILAKPSSKFISRLVSVDKILSHYYIRPALWKSGFGITIPGQCFIIKREAFKGRLPDVDTYLDDLALGLFVHKNFDALKVYYGGEVIGYEESNDSFIGLFKQRSRWAHGFLSVMKATACPRERKLVIIHGLSYHSLWIIHWLCIIILTFCSPMLAACYVVVVTLLLTKLNYRMFVHGILYQIVFPIFHMRWMQSILLGLK